jgi:adenosylcobinamide kinase/adenosylcobinamide-phosphate guanylyltransferase
MMTLVIGGSASGKSEWAENLVRQGSRPLIYLATLKVDDEESRRRVERHRQQRANAGFMTIERPLDLAGLQLPHRGSVLLECLGTLVANELFLPGGAGEAAAAVILDGVTRLADRCDQLVLVSNDLFADGIAYIGGTRRYLDVLADVNRALGCRCDRVAEVVCGIAVLLKDRSDQAGRTA